MKSPEIDLVKKWLDNPESVSEEELERAADAANAARAAARAASRATAVAVYGATANAARAASRAAVDGNTARANVDHAKYWIEIYEELTQ
tara:strand:- start:77 stop:346 length:270 start_codon:yes stop_codon:yes gene_type:complete